MYLRKWESRETVPFFLRPHSTPPPQIFLVQWKIPEDRLCNVAELWMESKTKTARRFTAKNPWWKNDFLEGGRIKFPKRFCLVGTRYFASETNYWYSIWYYNYGRTWSITSLPGFSPKASGFYPFGDATDLVRGLRWWCGVADSSLCLKSDMPQH